MDEDATLLRPGDTCWRAVRADRAAVLLDFESYYAALASALTKAQRSILILGWTFDPRTVLEPGADGSPEAADGRVGALLRRLSDERPELEVRLLVWRMDLPIAATQGGYPLRAPAAFRGSRVQFKLDRGVPLGACHHQKVVVIDDAVAFSGGGDVSVDRWDTPAHPDRDPRRTMPSGKAHPPRHDVMMVVAGPAARALGDLFRRRWLTHADETLVPVEAPGDPWPDGVAPLARHVRVGIARTEPVYRGAPGSTEVERLHLAAIAQARTLLVLENQYVASPVVEVALELALQAAEGPEIVVITTRTSPSWFDRMTMDRTRAAMIGRLRASDVYGRFRAFCPVTAAGGTIIVHSKLTIVDDRLLRVGSANLNNRSFGFDTECDVAIEAETTEARAAVRDFRARLFSHWLGIAPAEFEAEDAVGGPGVLESLDRLAVRTGRLIPVPPYKQGPLRNMIALHHLGDPVEPTDSWLPWLRTGKLKRRTQALLGSPLRNRR